jgi:hypothetical protein
MPVRLKLAFNQNYAVSGMTFDWTALFVKVANLAFDKQVVVAYTRDGGTTWNTVTAATSARPGDRSQRGRGRGLEVQDPAAQRRTRVERVWLRRVLRGDGLGVTYWDNNFGQDYFLSQTAGSTLA